MATALPATGIRPRSARSVADKPALTPIWHPSPNFGARRDGALPDMVMLHYTAMPSTRAALDWLCNPEAEVSAHYLVGRCGTVWQMVREADRAWHAGAGAWGTADDVNSRSVGIEISNDGSEPFGAPQMAAVEALLRGIMARWAIPPQRVVAHSDTAIGRKIDPGARFDWRALARQGLAVWPQPGAAPGDFAASARRFGYVWDETGPDPDLDPVLTAFRLRFRPWARGALSDADRSAMADLAARYPVDTQALLV